MPRIGANRPLNERVIFELGEDFQLADEDALGGGGAGASASFAESSLFVSLGWVSGINGNPVQFDELYFGSADTLGLFAQLPASDIAVGPGFYNLSIFANPTDFGDATVLSVSLVASASGGSSYVAPAQTGVFVVGGGVSWDNFDLSTTLFVPTGETGSISVFVADDSTMGSEVASDMTLTVFRVFDFA